jgi:DNA adenine methylase
MSDIKNAAFASKPFLKWAGGKRQIIETLQLYYPEKFGTYIEPFVGGGAVFFDLAHKIDKAVIADLNLLLIRCYWSVRNAPKKLITILRKMEGDYLKSKDRESHYYEVRSQDPYSMNQEEGSAWLIFMNRTCFNGLYRVNRKGQFNVPHGDYKNPTILDETNILNCSAALRRAEIYCEDFRKILKEFPRKGDFVYLDPPYIPLTKTANFTSYTNDGFGPNDQRDLAAMAKVLKMDGVHVLVSGSGSPETESLYKDQFTPVPVKARRNINSDALGRDEIKEFIFHASLR